MRLFVHGETGGQLRLPQVWALLACLLLTFGAGCGDDNERGPDSGPGIDGAPDSSADLPGDAGTDTATDSATDRSISDSSPDVELMILPPDECDLIAQSCPADQKCTITVESDVWAARCVELQGSAQLGEDCEITSTTRGDDTCAAGGMCPAWTEPQQCLPLCRTTDDCSPGEYCQMLGLAERVGACVAECDPFNDTCPTGTQCDLGFTFDDLIRHLCATGGNAGLDEPCGPEALCQTGMVCVGRCYPMCEDAHPCAEGVTCQPWSFEAPDHDGLGICVYGNQGPAEPCVWDDGTTAINPESGACEAGLTCLGGAGWASCTRDADCQLPGTLNAQCIDGSCGQSFCGSLGCADNSACETLLGEGACCVSVGNNQTACLPAELCPSQGAGEACAWNEVNAEAGLCLDGLVCLGGSDFGSCITDEDCAGPGLVNADCVAGQCGHSFCSSLSCSDDASCETTLGAGACCIEINEGSETACLPPALCGSLGPGEPCSLKLEGVVLHPDAGLCQDGLSCYGLRDPAQTCTTDEECGGPGNYGCFEGTCGMTFCSALGSCTVAADCSAYGADACCLPVGGTSEMLCGPAASCPAVGAQSFDQACNVDDVVNPTAGDCALDLFCVASHLDGDGAPAVVPCTEDADCGGAPDDFGCFGGFCGRSFCSHPCSSDSDCATWGADACCRGTPGWCVAADQCASGTIAAGEPCSKAVYGVTGVGECLPELQCIGYYAPQQSSAPLSCTQDTECVAQLGIGATCYSGFCSATWCSSYCFADEDCAADYGAGACCQASACYTPEVCLALGL